MDIRKLKGLVAALLVAKKIHNEVFKFLEQRLPRLGDETDCDAWKARAAQARARFLELYFRGHPPGLCEESCAVEWREILEPGAGYRIRKLLYEGYPGLWVPALLYEPSAGEGKIPVVLNAGAHHLGGLAVSYSQARCINLAKRGMLALSFEFLGMGELSASRPHTRISQLDLLGIQGAGVFYLVMKRALDVLLSHPRADSGRVAMTGLSGGGWQTIVLSALDERITASIPVAGHTSVWQRISHPPDVGDSEQLPVDFCTVGDYDVLSAMLAPRPTLFIFNHADTCCFATPRARVSIVEPARRYFALLGAADKVEMHDNTDPGTHNYERDNREKLYSFLNRAFGLDAPLNDLVWEDELYGEEALSVGVPQDNGTLLSLAIRRSRALAAQRKAQGPEAAAQRAADPDGFTPDTAAKSRVDLRGILRLPADTGVTARNVRSSTIEGIAVRQLAAKICGWSVPMIHARPKASSRGHTAVPHHVDGPAGPGVRQPVPAEGAACSFFAGGEIVLAVEDSGRQEALERALLRCRGAGRKGGLPGPVPAHILAMDLFGTGELRHYWKTHMLLGAVGERPLGIQAAMILSAARWMKDVMGGGKVSLQAGGMTSSVAALAAAALEPSLFSELWTEGLPVSLSCLIEWPVDFEAAPSLFCFGLLERFDVPDLIRLSSPVRVAEVYRGPLP